MTLKYIVRFFVLFTFKYLLYSLHLLYLPFNVTVFQLVFPPCVLIQVVLFEFENFQGQKAEFSAECKDVSEKGLEKVGSLLVESGP